MNIVRMVSAWLARVRSGAQLALFSASAVLVYWVTVFLMRWGSGRTPASARFARTVEFQAWTGLLGVNVAVWIMVAIWLWPRGMVWKRERDHIGVAAPAVIYLVLAFLVYAGLARVQSLIPNPLYWAWQRTLILTVLAFACAMPGVLGVWRLSARLHAIKQQMGRTGAVMSPHEIIGTLRECRLDMLSCVGGIGVIITGAVLASAALRAAILAADLPVRHYQFPATWLLFLGAYFTTVLSLIAVPAFISWRVQAVAFVARTYPAPPDGRLSPAWEAERAGLKRHLHIERTTTEIAANVLGLLAPLLIAVLGVLVSKG